MLTAESPWQQVLRALEDGTPLERLIRLCLERGDVTHAEALAWAREMVARYGED